MSEIIKSAMRPLSEITERLRSTSTPVQLEDILLALAKYGEPRLSLQSNGWYCVINMRVTSVGVEFKVASEFGNPTPNAAAAECCQRVEQTLQDISAGATQ